MPLPPEDDGASEKNADQTVDEPPTRAPESLDDSEFCTHLDDTFSSWRSDRARDALYRALLGARDECTLRLGRGGPAESFDGDDDEDGEESANGIHPLLLMGRAKVYEALGSYECALADAYVSYTLCEVANGATGDSDLRPVRGWAGHGQQQRGAEPGTAWDAHRLVTLRVLVRCVLLLGLTQQAEIWGRELRDVGGESKGMAPGLWSAIRSVVMEAGKGWWFVLFPSEKETLGEILGKLEEREGGGTEEEMTRLFGQSQRVVYPWNTREPERMAPEALEEINARLQVAAPRLEAKKSVLPALGGEGADQESAQLGLFAKTDLAPGETALRERSVLTGIRPHGEALCDGCAADMEGIPSDERRACQGCGLPFCSEECYALATELYHAENSNDEETDEGYPPAESPFCPGNVANEDIHTLGRAESSTTPEWDLYFLLLTRTMQMAETQGKHPLELFDIKYLWGDFSPAPDGDTPPGGPGPKTLPYSLRHHVELPLQWFEILMHSRPDCRPYSQHWLENYDWWIVQTLFAKFRGVADAQLSTWTGKPEVSGVHPLWCLANHSCDPNVTWKPSGVRNLTVTSGRIGTTEWNGIQAGEEIWNHYTDINEKDPTERRARLQGVLGGECRCPRCTAETASG